MKKFHFLFFFLIFITACSTNNNLINNKTLEINTQIINNPNLTEKPTEKVEVTKMQISVKSDDKEIIFELNNNQASKELYEQLPLIIEVEDYASNEKIFYPPKKLDTSNTPLANAKTGTLAYYAPWGDVVMFYKDFGTAAGLYELGKVVSGEENIKNLSGTIGIKKT